MELFKSMAHVDIVHIPYKEGRQAVTDLIGGQIPAMTAPIPGLLAQLQAGKARALAVTGPQRAPQLPSVPTMVESGYPGFVVTTWSGMLAPAGTPAPILDKLHTDLIKVLQMPDLRERLNELVIDPAPQSREEFAAFMRAETTRWARVVKDANIPKQ
jgi:tripartite-type tricarboxylate transporter receptor subunit TctC